MKCEQIQPELLDYAKGRLTGPEADEVRKHIGHCAECAALLGDEVAFAGLLESMPNEAPASDVWALVRARTRPRIIRPIVWLGALSGSAFRKAAAAAVAVALLLFVFYGFKPGFQEPERKATSTQTVVKWSDDPLGGNTDATIALIDKM